MEAIEGLLGVEGTELIGRSLLVLLVISLMIVASRLSGNFTKPYGGQIRGTPPVTSLIPYPDSDVFCLCGCQHPHLVLYFRNYTNAPPQLEPAPAVQAKQ